MPAGHESVYLCGGIYGCSDDAAKAWRQMVAKKLYCRVEVIDPMKRDFRGREEANYREIVDLDKADIRRSTIILMNYIRPSVGSSMEVLYAWQLGKPVLVWTEYGVEIPPWLFYHSTKIVKNFSEAMDWIQARAGIPKQCW